MASNAGTGKNPGYIIFLVTAVLTAPSLHAQEPPEVPVPVFIDGIYEGEIPVVILQDDTVLISPSELIVSLEEYLSEDAVTTARKIFPASGRMNLTGLGGLGVRILFKFEDLSLHVEIPVHLKKEKRISVSGTEKEPEGIPVAPEEFSAFLNLNLWSRFTYETLVPEFSLAPEAAVNLYGWAAEARGGIRTGDELLFLDYARIVKDFLPLGFRLEIGDIRTPVYGISGTGKITGLSFYRKNFSTKRKPLPFRMEIFLREPSKVSLYLNDVKIKEGGYSSGAYIFEDFQLSRGINRLRLEWMESDGPHTEELIVPFEYGLLDAGEFDLGITAGIPDRKIMLPTASAWQYIGISDTITAGITEGFNSAAGEPSVVLDLLLSTPAGSFSLRPEWGMKFSGGQRIDIPLGYQFIRSGSESFYNFGGTLRFTHNSVQDPETPVTSIGADGYYDIKMDGGFSLTPRIRYEYFIETGNSIFKARADFKKRIKGGSALTAQIGLEYIDGIRFTATVSFSSSFPEANQNIYIIQNMHNQKLSAFWNRYASDSPSDFTFNAAAELPMQLDDRISVDLGAGFFNDILSVSVNHDFGLIVDTNELHNATTLTASAAAAYAGGFFAFSSPIYDSFVIIPPAPQFSGINLLVNPSGGNSSKVIKDSAAIIKLSSYSDQEIRIVPEEAVPGLDDSSMHYLVRPSYKSAFVIEAEAETSIFAGGYLLGEDGTPVAFAAGSLAAEDGSGFVSPFFTDEQGYFEVYNLKPGTYTMKLVSYEGELSVQIGPGTGGFSSAGEIVWKYR